MPATQPPWEVDGLPHGLTEEHFEAAARIVVTGLREEVAGDRLDFVTGTPQVYFRLSGTHYPHNLARLDALRLRTPLVVDRAGRSIYPAILVPDPSTGAERGQPVGACGTTGYLGSAWNDSVTEMAAGISRGVHRRRFLVSRLLVERDSSEVKVWLPSSTKYD
jgi:hypothetical protein